MNLTELEPYFLAAGATPITASFMISSEFGGIIHTDTDDIEVVDGFIVPFTLSNDTPVNLLIHTVLTRLKHLLIAGPGVETFSPIVQKTNYDKYPQDGKLLEQRNYTWNGMNFTLAEYLLMRYRAGKQRWYEVSSISGTKT